MRWSGWPDGLASGVNGGVEEGELRERGRNGRAVGVLKKKKEEAEQKEEGN